MVTNIEHEHDDPSSNPGQNFHKILIFLGGCPRGVMVKAMSCGIVVLQSRYYIHFPANTLGKGMNPLILPSMG